MKKRFVAPKAKVLHMHTENIICGSGTQTPTIETGEGEQPGTPQARDNYNGIVSTSDIWTSDN